MTIKSRKFAKGIRLKGTQDAATLDGEIRNDEDVKRLKVYLETDGVDPAGEREIVTSDQTQTLQNKTIDGAANNITNVSAGSIGNLVEDLSVPENAHDSIPSALAVQEYVENTSAASSSDLIYHMSDKSTHGTLSDIVGKDDAQTLTNKTIDSASNTLTVNADEASVSELETDNFKTGVVDNDSNLAANSSTSIPTQQAVKAYVDAVAGGIVSDASAVTYTQNQPTDWQESNNVAGSLDELAARASSSESEFNDHLYTIGDKHNSEEILYSNTIGAQAVVNVKEALDQIESLVGSGAALDITYDDSATLLGVNNVQAAIEQLDQNIGNAGNDVQAFNSYYVCQNSGNDTNPGSLLQPFATIQKAIDQVKLDNLGSSTSVINVDYGRYNENLVLADAYNIVIIGKGVTDTSNCWILGTVDLTNSENIKFKNFRIEQASTTPTITMARTAPTNPLVDTGGRHFFESCLIHNTAVGEKALDLQDGVVEFNVFRACTFIGSLDLTQSSYQNGSITLLECASETAPIIVDNTLLTAVDCYSIGHITHTSGIIALKDIHSMERDTGACVDSTAPAGPPTNVIYLEDVSTYDLLTNDYGAINIAGAFVMNACSRNPAIDNVNELLRLTRGQRSEDIAYDTTDVKTKLDELSATPNPNISALDIDWSSNGIYYKDITVDSTFTFSNDSDGQSIKVIINNTDASPHVITFPAGIKTDPSYSGTVSANTESIFTLVKSNNKIYVTEVKDLTEVATFSFFRDFLNPDSNEANESINLLIPTGGSILFTAGGLQMEANGNIGGPGEVNLERDLSLAPDNGSLVIEDNTTYQVTIEVSNWLQAPLSSTFDNGLYVAVGGYTGNPVVTDQTGAPATIQYTLTTGVGAAQTIILGLTTDGTESMLVDVSSISVVKV